MSRNKTDPVAEFFDLVAELAARMHWHQWQQDLPEKCATGQKPKRRSPQRNYRQQEKPPAEPPTYPTGEPSKDKALSGKARRGRFRGGGNRRASKARRGTGATSKEACGSPKIARRLPGPEGKSC